MESSEYLTVSEVAEKLRVAESTIYKWIAEGKLRAAKFGRVKRIRKTEFEKFVKQAEEAGVEE